MSDQQVREAFEAFCHKRWANSTGDLLDKREDGEYYNHRVQFAWSSWQEAARQAIERCAEVCDDQEEPAWYGYENPNTFDDGKRACASAIRALTHESEKRHGH